jgi:hypothetical protein
MLDMFFFCAFFGIYLLKFLVKWGKMGVRVEDSGLMWSKMEQNGP